MSVADQMDALTQDLISSYEDRLSTVESIFSDTHQMLDDFQKALFETREEREILSQELREKLAKTESLRRKDFDQMMQAALKEQSDREKEVRTLLEKYITEQKEVAAALKEGLADFNKQLVKGEQIRLEDFKQKFAEIKEQQLERQNQVTKMLKDFQAKVAQYRKENEELAKGIKGLLSKGERIRIRDFKTWLRELQQERKEAISAWQGLSVAMAKKRAEAAGGLALRSFSEGGR
jgi:nucleoid DNA-binding protein